jgi:hypothetical protein
MAWPWRRRPVLDRSGSLAARPLRNALLEWSRDEEGLVVLRLPRKESWWVKGLARVFYIPKGRTFSLDEPGSFVWELCDGTTPIRAIIQRFAEQFQLTRKEAEVSTLQYFRLLARRGFVGLRLEQERAGREREKGS